MRRPFPPVAAHLQTAAEIAAWHRPRMPISGGALIKRGLPEGPVVAKTLRAIEDRWLEAGFPSGETLEKIISDALAAAAH